MDEQDRTVDAFLLAKAGYELRDGYFVQRLGDREIVFKPVERGQYVFDGEREAVIDVEDGERLF